MEVWMMEVLILILDSSGYLILELKRR